MSELDDIKKLVDDLEAIGIAPAVVINVNIGSGGGGSQPPAPPPEAEESYLVQIDKPSKRAKVRREANPASGEVDFVYDGEIVFGPGKTVNGFVYVTRRISGQPLIDGFVEGEYLVKR